MRSVREARTWTRVVLGTAAAFLLGMLVFRSLGGGNAGYTTFDSTLGGCLDNPTGVDCNNYAAKPDVYMDGGPVGGGGLDAGYYYFTVIVPGYQNGGFTQGATGNLSDTTPGTTPGDLGSGDGILDRTFHVTNGVIDAYAGPHVTGFSKKGQFIIALSPYDDTSNAGGVYILAICATDNHGTEATSPSQCKYDAFRISPPATPTPTPTPCVDGDCPTPTPTPTPCETGCQTQAPLTIDKDATGSFTWDITKDVDHTKLTGSTPGTFNYTVKVSHDKGTVSGIITIGNDNPVDITGVTVTDTILNEPNATCDVTGGTNFTVAANDSVNLAYSCTYTAAPASLNETNEAVVTWPNPDPFGDPLTASKDVPFSFGDTCVTVTDANDPDLPATVCVGDNGTAPDIDVDGTFTFTYSKSWNDPAGTCTSHDNTAAFTTNTTGTTGSAGKTVTDCVGADLTVSKNATPTMTRTYNWTIAKNVDKTLVEQSGGTATFNYSVTAAETGFTDSGWSVTGTISVTNPNDFEAITASVTDSIDNGGSCAVTGGVGVSIPAGGTKTFSYTCSYASAPSSYSGTNTGTATWDAAAAGTPHGTASGTAGATFTPTTTVNKTITVTDTFNGVTTTLGTLTATDSTPYTSKTYTYSHTITVPASNCLTYPNTAKIVETGQSSSASVEVCGPAKTGGLTMGFWQNKNGQGIITGQASSGTCPSTTWLRQFAPFQDLGATATCSAVATYVTNVIKSASASGAAMNAMLKGQMLATSLDVYFSSAALGGNKIGAPAPIGPVVIDLTKICKMIDGSGGTGTCSGSYESASPAFGGASSLSVSGMLTFSSSQSNVGGTVWYGQVKATQGLAKDAFDAVNNGVAFSP